MKQSMLKTVSKKTSIALLMLPTDIEPLMGDATTRSFQDGDQLEADLIEWRQ